MKEAKEGTMVMFNRSVRRSWTPYRVIMPGIAGSIMFIASLTPWLLYPTGERFLAWQLPVDIGWQLHSIIFNYGLLCSGCACYIFFIMYMAWKTLLHPALDIETLNGTSTTMRPLAKHMSMAALFCLVPSLLFLLQYLFIDMQSIATLTRGELQILLVKTHLGYGVADQFFPIQSLTFHPLNVSERFGLLLDHSNIGLFLPLVSIAILLSERVLQPGNRIPTDHGKRGSMMLAVLSGILTIIVLGRGPTAFLCTYQAEHSLSAGNYNAALQLLDAAHLLNPSLDQLAAYHIERGQAWYFLHPQQPDLESRAYLAAYYRQQNDLLSSYQELMEARLQYPHTQWLTDEISLSIERLAELSTPLKGQQTDLLDNDTSALSWLYQLAQIDPTNIYAHYTIGRILYDIHDYSDSEVQMRSVLALNALNDVQSSAYTYMALSKVSLGDDRAAREYLFKAQDLDPEYRNNMARQSISGLR